MFVHPCSFLQATIYYTCIKQTSVFEAENNTLKERRIKTKKKQTSEVDQYTRNKSIADN